jgi:hypothetical protein
VIWSAGEGLRYRQLARGAWGVPVDLSDAIEAPRPGVGDLVRSSLAADRTGLLHLVAATLGIGQAKYTRAPIGTAAAPAGWSKARQIGVHGAGYYCAVAVDSRNRIHTLYIERPAGTIPADTFYRRSDDHGRTWSPQVNLSGSPSAGSSRPQLVIDSTDRLHVTWDEGWDRISGKGTIATSIYRWSSDGNAWSPPVSFGSARTPSAQLVVARSGRDGGTVAVWRSTDDNVYFQQAPGDGKAWSLPAPVPGIAARPWNSPPFDQYALAADDRGLVHLAVVGRLPSRPGSTLPVLHLTWDGHAWSSPDVVFDRPDRYPEYPRLAAGPRGVHLVWFARTDLWDSAARKEVWYSEERGQQVPNQAGDTRGERARRP